MSESKVIIMSKVIDCFKVENYMVLKVDEMPKRGYDKFRIEGIEFDPVPIYDMPQCIAIESNKQFLNKVIEFI